MKALEVFCCSGGMSEGFRRAGIVFDFVFDKDNDACDSYEANHGNRPVQMDVIDLLRMVKGGWSPGPIDFAVFDPPCTPWSRAGKREGLDDPRDCLAATAELIALLRPRAYLIGNVPGLQDSTSWGVVQKVIGGLAREGYCVKDYASLDAADYGVPQHRVRPFWFGHLEGSCIRWPAPTHAAASGQLAIGGAALAPWVTCRQALQHLSLEELGRPVRMKIRDALDGHPAAREDAPAPTIRSGGAGHSAPQSVLLVNDKHPMSRADEPAMTVTAHLGATGAAQGGSALFIGDGRDWTERHPTSVPDAPAQTIVADGGRAGKRSGVLAVAELVEPRPDCHPISEPDEPSKAIVSSMPGNGGSVMRLPDPNRPPASPDEPHRTISTARDQAAMALKQPLRGTRVGGPDRPSDVVTTDPARVGAGPGQTLTWPWDRHATTILGDERLSVPGHHDAKVGNASHKGPNAVVLSERAAAILQGFPDGECDSKVCGGTTKPGEKCACGEIRRWHFCGETKRSRWSSLGQAMPPPLAHAVATAVVEQMKSAAKQ